MGVTGRPAWSADSSAVIFTDGQGQLRRYDPTTNVIEVLPFSGDSPVSMADGKLVFRRTKPTLKVESQGTTVARDPGEVVLGDPATKELQVLLRETSEIWEPRRVSPDGRWLILASERLTNDRSARRGQFFLLDLKAALPAEPRPLGEVGMDLEAAFWAADGKALVFALRPTVYPPDCWETPAFDQSSVEVFHLDLTSDKLTRLTRGGTVTGLAVRGRRGFVRDHVGPAAHGHGASPHFAQGRPRFRRQGTGPSRAPLKCGLN